MFAFYSLMIRLYPLPLGEFLPPMRFLIRSVAPEDRAGERSFRDLRVRSPCLPQHLAYHLTQYLVRFDPSEYFITLMRFGDPGAGHDSPVLVPGFEG